MKKINKFIKDEEINYISNHSFIINILLFIVKMIIGIFGKSFSLISESIYSVINTISTLTIKLNKTKNKEKNLCIKIVTWTFILLCFGVIISIINIVRLYTKYNFVKPSILTLIIIIVSIIIKEVLYFINNKKINDDKIIKSNKYTNIFELIAGIVSIIGISLSLFNISYCDSISSIIIFILIIRSSIGLFIESIDKVIDKSPDDEILEKIKKTILSNNEVLSIKVIKAKTVGNKILVYSEVFVDNNLTKEEIHEITSDVHGRVKSKYSIVKQCLIVAIKKED